MVVLERPGAPSIRRRPEAGEARACGNPLVGAVPWAPGRPDAEPRLDETQEAALAYRGGRAVVLGAPGTGKTTVAVHAVLARIRQGADPGACLLLAASRSAAAQLRDRIAAAVPGAAERPLARTPSSLAFALLSARAAAEGLPAPRLLSGPEQDVILRELLAGHAEGAGKPPVWPDGLGEALGRRGFRSEMRDLLMRATERDLPPAGLAALGRRHRRGEWVAAAAVADEYEDVAALASPGAYDPAAILGAAADALEGDDGLLPWALPGLGLVVVDDAQELTPPAVRLLDRIGACGVDLLLIGDPDAASQTFRGADPRAFTALGRGGPVHMLGRRWRQRGEPAAVTDRVARRIGVLGVSAHRAPMAVEDTEACGRRGSRLPSARVILARSAAEEDRHVVSVLRAAHLVEGRPWSAMAVVVRGSGRAAPLRRALLRCGVPHQLSGAQEPLRNQPVAKALLALVRVSLAVAREEPRPLSRDEALDLLASPLGGVDGLTLRRLRRALRRSDGGGSSGGLEPERVTEETLVAGLLGDPVLEVTGAAGEGARRLARAIAAGARAAGREGARWAPGVSAESVLWAVWDALDLADSWRAAALAGGPAGTRADRDLDAAVALFDAAERYVDRLPGRGPEGFVAHVAAQDVAGDSLVEQAPADDVVTVTTPQGAAGREWDLVVIAGLQDGVWPDLRVRGSLLGSQELVDRLAGRGADPRAALTAVAHDEARLFHVAVSRTRGDLVVTAVVGEDEQPSPFVELVEQGATDPARAIDPAPRELTLTGVVAQLRREVVLAPTEAERRAAARRLLLLADRGVPGAAPGSWWGLDGLSDDRPRRDEHTPVVVSPSHVESFGQCELRWFFHASGAEPRLPGGSDAVGSLVHAIAAEIDCSDAAALHAALDERWGSLGLPAGWISERRRLLAHDMLGRLARYHAQSSAEGWQVVGREVPSVADLGVVQVRGRIDRLERREDGALRVIDLKTGSSKPRRSDLARHGQLGAYQALVEAGALAGSDLHAPPDGGSCPDPRRSAGAGLLHLGRAAATTKVDLQLQPALGSDEDPGWAERLLQRTAAGMAGSSYAARTGTWCRTCRFRGCCPASGDGEEI